MHMPITTVISVASLTFLVPYTVVVDDTRNIQYITILLLHKCDQQGIIPHIIHQFSYVRHYVNSVTPNVR